MHLTLWFPGGRVGLCLLPEEDSLNSVPDLIGEAHDQ